MGRPWFKVWIEDWLYGSASYRSLYYQAILIKLEAFSLDGKHGPAGEIRIDRDVGIPDKELAQILMPDDSPEARKRDKIWPKIKAELIEEGEISVGKRNVITMLKVKKYQSEYDRTKKYRSPSTNGEDSARSQDATENATENATPTATSTATSNDTRIEYRVESISKERIDKKEKREIPISQKVTDSVISDLQGQYPRLDVGQCWTECQAWYRDHHKRMKWPRQALENWLKKEKGGDVGKHRQDTGIPGNRPAGAFDSLEGR